MDENNSDVKLALEEMRFNMKASLDASDALDNKLHQILVGSGAIIALTTTLQLSLLSNRSNLYWFMLLLAVALYLLTILMVLIGASPQSYHLAIASDWEELNQYVFGKLEREAMLNILAGYVDQIQYNHSINSRKVCLFRICLIIMPIIIILLVSLVAIQ